MLQLLRDTPIPSTVKYVAQRLHLAWGTARAMLLDLVVRNKVTMQKTTHGSVFWAKGNEKCEHLKREPEEMGSETRLLKETG